MKFGADSLQLGLIGAARSVTYGVFCVGAALISSTSNRRKVVALSAVSVAVMLALTGMVANLWQLFAAAMLLAVALSFYWPTLLAWVGDSHSPKELSAATGAVNVGWSIGGMTGGLISGILFRVGPSLPFFAACIPAFMACLASLIIKPRDTVSGTAEDSEEPRIVSKKELAGAWFASLCVFCLFGLMSSVFPKLGSEIGITSDRFGILVFFAGAARTLVFAFGTRWGQRLTDWRISTAVQAVTVVMVSTVCYTSSHMWMGIVFVALGLSAGTAYYRSLYTSLEGKGSKVLKSGAHEAILIAGLLAGTIGGGAIAQKWGLRAPYVPVAGLAMILLAVQVILALLARREQNSSTARAA
jgi:predicted MFS family arabinose efflux permease